MTNLKTVVSLMMVLPALHWWGCAAAKPDLEYVLWGEWFVAEKAKEARFQYYLGNYETLNECYRTKARHEGDPPAARLLGDARPAIESTLDGSRKFLWVFDYIDEQDPLQPRNSTPSHAFKCVEYVNRFKYMKPSYGDFVGRSSTLTIHMSSEGDGIEVDDTTEVAVFEYGKRAKISSMKRSVKLSNE